ncbi:MAG: hypothetical protein JWM63_1112 [Gammaproteobacteria bacterium]|nr:hypothetical protein [Gammaproteobacteria bacterium]
MPRRRVARVPRLQRVLVDHVPTQRWRLPLARSQVGIPQAAGRWRERVIQQRLLLNPRPGLQRSLRRFPTALQRSRRLRSIPPRSRADHFASGYRKTAAAVPMPARRSSAGRPPTGSHVPRSIVATMEKLSFASLPVWSLYAHSGRCRPAAAPPKWVRTRRPRSSSGRGTTPWPNSLPGVGLSLKRGVGLSRRCAWRLALVPHYPSVLLR